MTVQAKVNALQKEFPGLKEVLSWFVGHKQVRPYTPTITVRRADIGLLEQGSYTDLRMGAFFALKEDGAVVHARRGGFIYHRKTLFFFRKKWVPGESVQDLILRTDPSVIVGVSIFYGTKVVVYKSRKGMSFLEFAQRSEEIAEMEVQEEVQKAEEGSTE